MKRTLAVLLVALLGMTLVVGPAFAQAKGKSNGAPPLYPPGQTGCSTEQEHGGCPAPGKGKTKGTEANPGTTSSSTTSTTQGGTVPATGSGFKPNSKVKATAYSTPVELGVIETDATGAFDTTLTIPAEVEPGAHTIKFTGVGADDQPRELQQPLVITGAPLVSFSTTTGWLPIGIAALVVLVIGGIALSLVRSRRVAAEGI